MRRVVVTGIGMVSPVGANVDDSWANLLAGKSGAARVTRMDVSDMACQVGCEVKTGDGTNGTFNCDDWMEPKEQRRYDTFIKYGLAAAKMAVRDSGWVPKDRRRGLAYRGHDRFRNRWRLAIHRGDKPSVAR